ncbi:MAG: PKD domain-containing protein [Bacteroidales bacterium]|nr:PKD domain-containing protein [Bacteroidales bacterium]MBN2817480.1 PKD domain-containing protein [Bacteroidales bacterium]
MIKKIALILLLFISLCSFGQKYIKVVPLREVNTDYDEMAPAFYEDGIIFSSNRKSNIIKVATDFNNNYYYKLYSTKKKSTRKFENPKPFATEIAGNLNEASATFSDDFKVMYITRNFRSDESLSQLQKSDEVIKFGIFQATFTGKDWILSCEFPFNDESYRVRFPTLSFDGKKLFFCSDMPGGYGGDDLYLTELINGRWSNPMNLGPTVNTAENEVWPFYHQVGRLYFSSRGHGSQGGLDIFYTEIMDGEWIKPVNLPSPFNSFRDEFGYILSPTMDTGYFVRNNRISGDDIYIVTNAFPLFKECPPQFDESFCYEFEEEGSLDLDTTSLKYEWDFGDGQKVRSTYAKHCFSKPGFYMVSLNVIDTLTQEVYFSEASYDLLIEPSEQPYITAPDTVNVNEKVKLDAKLSEIRKFEAKEYFWDFGDGNINMGEETEHVYDRAGTFYIRLGITTGEDEPENEEDIDFSKRACSQKQIIVIKNTIR